MASFPGGARSLADGSDTCSAPASMPRPLAGFNRPSVVGEGGTESESLRSSRAAEDLAGILGAGEGTAGDRGC